MTVHYSRKEFENEIIERSWKDSSFHAELLENPKAVLSSEYGVEFPNSVEVKIVKETANTVYLVLPQKDDITKELSDDDIEIVAGGAAAQSWCPVTTVCRITSAAIE